LEDGSPQLVTQVYKKISEYISDGFAVIYIVECEPARAISRMIGGVEKAKEYVESQALTVIDRDSFFLSPEGKRFNDMALEAIAKLHKSLSEKFKGVLLVRKPVLPSPCSAQDYQNLVLLEKQASSLIREPDECICCYDSKSLSNMPLIHLVHLIQAHPYVIRANGTDYYSSDGLAFTLIKRALDKFFGEESAYMVIRTLKLIYHMDEEFIVANPDIFENTIRKMFKLSSKEMLDTISEEIRAEIMLQSKKIRVGGNSIE
jgi:hypothetical protein